MSPVEVEMLRDKPLNEFARCPKCDEVFEPFMRGEVQRRMLPWWNPFSNGRPYCALICRACKRIVGWEMP